MRRGIGTFLTIAALGGSLVAGIPDLAPAHAAAYSIEKGLLGIRILQNYRDVYRKFGQPDRVYRPDQIVDWVEALDANGNPTGGVKGLDRNADNTLNANGRGGMPGIPGGPPGMPYSGAPGANPYRGMGGGPPGMPFQGKNEAPNMRPGGMPGMPGRPYGAQPGGIGNRRPGMSATAGGPSQEITFLEAGGFIWVYFNPKQELLYEFVFNRDGRVEIISEYGRRGGDRTQRGVGLGSPISAAYNAYGWPDSTDQNGRYLSLFYGPKSHVQFTVINNKIVGIGVMLREDQKIYMIDRGNQPNYGAGRGPNTPFGGRPQAGPPYGGAPYGGAPFGGRRGKED